MRVLSQAETFRNCKTGKNVTTFFKDSGKKGLQIQQIIFLLYFLQGLQYQLHGILSNQQVRE